MRDFRVTPEPSGKTQVSLPLKPRLSKKEEAQKRFVIQEHFARSHHFDFRLEVDGALKSWAVPKQPSLNPKDKRLAIQVEDHPLEYSAFQGVIPKGEYGAGKVEIWDQGTWEPHGSVTKMLSDGKLSFKLHGVRLHGEWALVRMKNSESSGKSQWLLFAREEGVPSE